MPRIVRSEGGVTDGKVIMEDDTTSNGLAVCVDETKKIVLSNLNWKNDRSKEKESEFRPLQDGPASPRALGITASSVAPRQRSSSLHEIIGSTELAAASRSRLVPLGSRVSLPWTTAGIATTSNGNGTTNSASSGNGVGFGSPRQQHVSANNSRACWPSPATSLGGESSADCQPVERQPRQQLAHHWSRLQLHSPRLHQVQHHLRDNTTIAVGSGATRELSSRARGRACRAGCGAACIAWAPGTAATGRPPPQPMEFVTNLFEPAVTAVDRLQKFRWSGGGGGGGGGGGSSGKKSSSLGFSRSSDKAERLRELTEKLKGPAPVPPPRRPSRANLSSPISHQLSFDSSQSYCPSQSQQQSDPGSANNGQVFCRSNTFSEGYRNVSKPVSPSSHSILSQPRVLGRSESAGEECYSDKVIGVVNNANRAQAIDGIRENQPGSGSAVTDVSCSDLGRCESVSSIDTTCIENEARDALVGLMDSRTLAADTYLRQTGPPHRSASFNQADLNLASIEGHCNNEVDSIVNARQASATSSSRKEVSRANTLPRVRRPDDEDDDHDDNRNENFNGHQDENDHEHCIASTSSLADSVVQVDRLQQQQPRPSDTSSSSAANTEDEAAHQLRGRPRSDASDSLTATSSSAVASPEPTLTGPSLKRSLSGVTGHTLHQGTEESDGTNTTTNTTTPLPSDGQMLLLLAEPATRVSGRLIEPHEVIITPPQEEQQEPQSLRLSQASETSEASYYTGETGSQQQLTAAVQAAVAAPGGKLRRYRGDTSKRRKGVYITQWPEPAENPEQQQRQQQQRPSGLTAGKLSGQSSEERDEPPPSATPSDLSDCEGQAPRRYSKRPLRGPYGQMLEAEMAKPRVTDLVALDDGLRPRRKVSANLSFNASSTRRTESAPTPCHHRTTSSPSKLEGLPGPSPELLAELLRGSSERVARAPLNQIDTRTHVVVELYDTERSYVEALQILVNKYLQQLKNPENAHLVEATIVDEIFYQVPGILRHHEVFLEELSKRLETWELQQTIGDVFLDVFTKPAVLETYTLFLDNWKSAKNAIKTTCQAKPAFARFLETMEREHKGKLGLDQLLIKPVQKIPRYELLIQRLLKHTDPSHPDYQLLTAALKEVHELVVKINCTERESLEWEQQQSTLKEVQSLVEGLAGIVTNDRAFIRHDLVSIASNQGTRKERGLFLFSDLLVVTSIKRRSGTIRKPSTNSCPNSLVGLLDANKYKMLMRISLDDLEVMKAKDENLRRMAREVDHLREDYATLGQIQELSVKLHGSKQQLEDLIKEMLTYTQKQLAERNAAHSQLACLELILNTQTGVENISVMFSKPDKRASWEESFNEAKQKLAASTDRRPIPEFVGPLPIRKTRAGLQFTCAAPTLANAQGSRDVWVCNSDGYVGQVCVLSLRPEPPQVTSCNGVCNARILSVAGIPACSPASSSDDSDSDENSCTNTTSTSFGGDLPNFGNGSVDEEFNQPTMWLGTEDGCIHVYNCSDNIRIKKNKTKLQHSSSVHSIIYLDNKVFVSLANGDIVVYSRDHHGGWNTTDPTTLSMGTVASPVTKMLSVSGKLWCASHNTIKILNTYTLEIEHTFSLTNDNNRPISCMANSGGLGVWISLHNSAILKLYHASSFECLADVNIAPAVTNMLANCDDIIRQHKAACLRVTSLLACNELLWVGTSAGVLLTVPIPHIKPSTQRMSLAPTVTGIPHGHTGHVRFLTCVEIANLPKSDSRSKLTRSSMKSKSLVTQQSIINSPGNASSSDVCSSERGRFLIISGGDGYEDFRGPQASAELQAGREDSTNHLLLWK
ncbi:hypothetical protein QAD02_014452, partial [Eretmocerus hayati]